MTMISPLLSLPGRRELKNGFLSDVDGKITQYEGKFKELKIAFQETGITVSYIFYNIESLGE
jgi:hypothetical protein